MNMHEQRIDTAIGIFNSDSGAITLPPPEYLDIQVFMRTNDVVSSTEVKEDELKLELCT